MYEYFNYLEQNPGMIPLFTGGAAFIGVLLSAFVKSFNDARINKKRIKADLVAKSRIEWIQEVRKLTAEFITLSTNTVLVHKRIINSKSTKDESKWIEEFYNNTEELANKQNLLKLYLPKYKTKKSYLPKYITKKKFVDINEDNSGVKMNLSNERYNYYIDEIRNYISILNYEKEEQKLDESILENKAENVFYANEELSNYSSTYLKNEWEKAKSIK